LEKGSLGIMKPKTYPVRMCISCRSRSLQKDLIRLQLINGDVVRYRGFGRSFYICQECIVDEKRVKNIIRRFSIKNGESFLKILKEYKY
jgi:predicted RNA-binding protein YlxR (DUF448 family)